MKFFQITLLATILAFVSADVVIWGTRRPNDMLIYTKDVSGSNEKGATVSCPDYQKVITEIVISGSAGTPKVTSGGVGKTFATINIKPENGKYSRTVEIYGR